MHFEIVHDDIARIRADAIVNAMKPWQVGDTIIL